MTIVDLFAALAIAVPLLWAGLVRYGVLRPDHARVMKDGARALWTSAALSTVAGFALIAGASGDGLLSVGPAAAIGMLLVGYVSGAVASFSVRHMRADPDLATYAMRVAVLSASALGVAVAPDILTFLVAWVASGMLLARLIGHRTGWVDAEKAAKTAQRTFIAGDAVLALGLIGLAMGAGSIQFSAILVAAEAGEVATLPALAILIGAAARSALIPFHNWLPQSVTAPTPISALMHAGLVNAGGVAVIKLAPVYLAAPAALGAAFLLGAATALFGGAMMLARSDVKGALAASTVGQMGFMMMQCGLGAFAHALFHIVAHGFFKAALFLGAGGNVGAKRAAPADPYTAPTLAVAGALGLIVISSALGAPVSPERPSTLLALFALATAAQAAGAALGPKPTLGGATMVALLGAAFGGLYVGGLALFSAALGPQLTYGREAGLLDWAAVIAFLLIWTAAASPKLRARLTPPALHMALINAGRTA